MNTQNSLENENMSNLFKKHMEELGIEIKDFLPIFYHEPKHRDALIFQIKDCSFREIEFDDYTLLLENHVQGKEIVGIKIHNITSRYDDLTSDNKKLSDYIRDVLQSKNQFFNNTDSFVSKCKELEIGVNL